MAEQSRELLAAIVDSSDDAIISKDLKGIITSWNKAAQKIFGYAPSEAIGQSITLLIPPDRLVEERIILERIGKGERIDHYETIRRAKNGALLNISLTISPVRDSEGKIIGASKIARDITEHRQTLELLRLNEERFRVTLESIGDAVVATDKVGKITFMNSIAENLTGWRLEEAIGIPLETIFKIVNEFSRQPVENPVTHVLRKGIVVGLANHTVLISKDGVETPIADSGAPIRKPTGEIDGVVLVFRDVTEQRDAELAAQRLAAIVQNSDDAIYGSDLSGTVTCWNKGAERIFGYLEKEISGQSILKLIPSDLQKEEEKIISTLQRDERIDHFETFRVAKDGRKIPVSVSASPIKDAEGNVIGTSKIARDITERKKAEEALKEAQIQLQSHAAKLEKQVRERTAMLENTVAELEAFSHSLSHDMRAPLRAITSFSQIVLKDCEKTIGEHGAGMLKKVVSAAGRMDRLISDLLAFTRLSREEMTVESIDVNRLIADIIQERGELQPPKAEITIKDPLLPMAGNETSLTQCITNLLDNAVKFVPRDIKPQVRIHSKRNGAMVRLWFEDNGIGIEPNQKQLLFQMFQRVHNGDYPGTGIGLAIVRKAAERMGGQVGVESELGKGSRFWLQLPAAEK